MATKREYATPQVVTLTAQELEEVVGPAQGWASGVSSGLKPKKKKGRGHGHGHGLEG